MIKKTISIVTLLLVLGVLPVSAAPGDLTITGTNTTVVEGEIINFEVSIPKGYLYSLTIKGTDDSVISVKINNDNCVGSKCGEPIGKINITVKGLKKGSSANLIMTGFVSVLHGDGTDKEIATVIKKISVLEKVQFPETKPVQPKPPVAPKPGLPQLDNTEADKAAEKLSPEAIAKKEAEIKEQELEAQKKIPLINGIEFTSQSEKFKGAILETIDTEVDVYEYSYTLPKRINEYSLKVSASEDVNLTYEEVHQFDLDENEQTITIKATKGEIDQTYTVLIKRTIVEPIEKNVFGSRYSVYDDERLDSFIEAIGGEKVEDTHFKFDELLFQLLVDSDSNAKWLLLNEDLTEKSFGIIYLNEAGELLFILESEDLENETLYGEKYSNKELALDERITLIDSSLNFESVYKGTTFEDGAIVYAMNSKGIKRNYFISDDSSFAYAAVAFDQVNMTYKYVAWFSSIALISLIGALLLTKILNRNKSL